MKEKILVGLAQIEISLFDSENNLKKIERFINQAYEINLDLIVFPELSNIGYITGRNKEFGADYFEKSEKIPGHFTNELTRMAKENNIHIICGMAEAHPTINATLYNTALFIDPDGKIIGKQHKIHIPGYEKHYFAPGNYISIFDSELGKIGIGICYDNQFCEYTRTQALLGADFITMIWNMPTFSNDIEMLYRLTSSRAFENRFYVLSCNRIGINNEITFEGHSCISNPVGNLISRASNEETLIVAELNRREIYEERAQMPIFRDRRPELYKQLIEEI